MSINLIVAMDENNGIGKDGTMPWPPNKEDLAQFRNKTMGGIVVMGRKTYESIPCTLSGRYVIVLSRTPDPEMLKCGEDGVVVDSLEAVMNILLMDRTKRDVWIAGGWQIYRMFSPFVQYVHITKIDGVYDCDTFFDFNKCSMPVITNKHQFDIWWFVWRIPIADYTHVLYRNEYGTAWGICNSKGKLILMSFGGTPAIALFPTYEKAKEKLDLLPPNKGYYTKLTSTLYTSHEKHAIEFYTN